MAMRKMRRYRRRSLVSVKRRRFKRRITRASKQPEVKFYTYQIYGVPLNLAYSVGLSTNLFPEQRMIVNLFAGITQGTSQSQRIGNEIFVKHITFRALVRGCPSDVNYTVGSFLTRMIVHDTGDTRLAVVSPIPDFFRTRDHRNINGIISRSEYSVRYDKTTAIIAREGPTTGLLEYALNGACQILNFKVPYNRKVTYIRDTTTVKENKDYLGLSAIVATPSMSQVTNTLQVACADITMTIYYTDS